MADDVAPDEVDDIFSDAAHEVADAFEFAAAAVHEHSGGFGVVIGAHELDALFEEPLVEGVDGLIADDDGAALLDVLGDEGGEQGVAEHGDALAELGEGGGEAGDAQGLELDGLLGD